MITKCANPDCDTEFHYSSRGRLFPYEIESPAEPCRDVSAVICDKKPERATVYFWLCSRCCRRFTLEFSTPAGLTLIPLNVGGALRVGERSSRDRDHLSRSHVSTHEHTNQQRWTDSVRKSRVEMKRATEILEREHRTIKKIVRVISVLADELTEARDLDGSILRDLCDFLRVYGNQCHQGKEESYLFPLLESRGVPEGGCPLGTLRHEHQRSRASTEALAEALTRYSANPTLGRQGLRNVLRDLACFYPEHNIWKEEYLLFPLATKVLSPQEDQLLVEEFASVEADIYRDAHERYEHLAADLERRVLAASPKMRGMMAEVA